MAYKYGSFQQPRIGSGYQYGGEEPSYINPNGLAAASAQRNATLAAQAAQWRQNNANSFAMRDQQRAYEDKLRADREDARQRNVMGISPLADQLADPYSAAYQWTMEDGRTPQEAGIGPEMTIGDENGSAPAPLPPQRLGKLSRMVRPEFAEAQSQMRTRDAVNTRAASPYDNPLRQREADVKEIGVLTGALENMDEEDPNYLPTQQRLSALIARSTVENAPGGQASGFSALSDGINQMMQGAGLGLSPLRQARTAAQAPVATPAPTPVAAPTPTPTPTPANSGIEMDVSNDQVIESSPKGTLVKRGNQAIFITKDGREIDVTDQVRAKGLI